MEQYVYVPINLNSASDETLLSIPGITPQALRALKEYRPYKNVQEFRTEIARYVNAKELGRFEHYIIAN